MRIIVLATFIFLCNVTFMPLLGMAHEMSHEDHAGHTLITWNDDQSSNGLFQVLHDETNGQSDLSVGLESLDHQCHHTSVIGMATFVYENKIYCVGLFNIIEPLFSIQSFPTLIDYPPIKV